MLDALEGVCRIGFGGVVAHCYLKERIGERAGHRYSGMQRPETCGSRFGSGTGVLAAVEEDADAEGLLSLARQILPHPPARELDALLDELKRMDAAIIRRREEAAAQRKREEHPAEYAGRAGYPR